MAGDPRPLPNGRSVPRPLGICWETGCRPQEVKAIEERHVQLAKHRVVFPASEAKGKTRVRVIYMTKRAEEIVRRLLKARPKGILFLNTKGRPWNYESMNCRFTTLKKHLGVKYAAYSLRHGFCQRMLENGVDHLTVAQLMGHVNGNMVAQTYSHMNQAHEHLREQLNRVAGNAQAMVDLVLGKAWRRGVSASRLPYLHVAGGLPGNNSQCTGKPAGYLAAATRPTKA